MDMNGTPRLSDRVAQASGIVSVQAECTVEQAVVLMETRAVASHVTIEDIARSVVAREIAFRNG